MKHAPLLAVAALATLLMVLVVTTYHAVSPASPLAGARQRSLIFQPAEEDMVELSKLELRHGLRDLSKKYQVFANILVGDRFVAASKEFNVTLCTQSSMDRLYWLPAVQRTWASAPVSWALLATNGREWAVAKHYLGWLRRCFPAVRANAAFHLMTFADVDWSVDQKSTLKLQTYQPRCRDDPKEVMDQMVELSG